MPPNVVNFEKGGGGGRGVGGRGGMELEFNLPTFTTHVDHVSFNQQIMIFWVIPCKKKNENKTETR